MIVELLVSALKAEPEELIKKMNIASNAVLINQCDRGAEYSLPVENGTVRVFCYDERGVGRSRNHALEKAEGDLLLFSDEDIRYDDGYALLVENEFINHPEADALFFNVRVCPERRTYYNTDFKRVGTFNAGRYPAYSIAIRSRALENRNLRYSLLFGGGAKYSCGEDSLFIKDCLRAGLKMYRTTVEIGEEVPRPSTWFNGYGEKFFVDRGVLYHFLYGRYAWIWGFRFVFAKKGTICRDIPWKKAYRLLLSGISEAKKIETIY